MDTAELLRAVIEFRRVWREQAPARTPTSWGAIYRDDRFPAIHDANLGWVVSLPEDGPSKILADLASAFRGTDVRHQALTFEDASEAYAVQEDLVRQGFRPTADLAMAKVGLPSCLVNPDVDVRPVAGGADVEDFRVLKTAIDAAFGYSAEVVDQLWRVWKERSPRVGMKPYIGYLNGTPAGTISVWPRGPFAWIDDIATHPNFRMRGVARTMIFDACRRAASAGCEWVVLTTDIFDTPKEMYHTLGFEPVGEVRGFVRE